ADLRQLPADGWSAWDREDLPGRDRDDGPGVQRARRRRRLQHREAEPRPAQGGGADARHAQRDRARVLDQRATAGAPAPPAGVPRRDHRAAPAAGQPAAMKMTIRRKEKRTMCTKNWLRGTLIGALLLGSIATARAGDPLVYCGYHSLNLVMEDVPSD